MGAWKGQSESGHQDKEKQVPDTVRALSGPCSHNSCTFSTADHISMAQKTATINCYSSSNYKYTDKNHASQKPSSGKDKTYNDDIVTVRNTWTDS